jgi:hypothetical protein
MTFRPCAHDRPGELAVPREPPVRAARPFQKASAPAAEAECTEAPACRAEGVRWRAGEDARRSTNGVSWAQPAWSRLRAPVPSGAWWQYGATRGARSYRDLGRARARREARVGRHHQRRAQPSATGPSGGPVGPAARATAGSADRGHRPPAVTSPPRPRTAPTGAHRSPHSPTSRQRRRSAPQRPAQRRYRCATVWRGGLRSYDIVLHDRDDLNATLNALATAEIDCLPAPTDALVRDPGVNSALVTCRPPPPSRRLDGMPAITQSRVHVSKGLQSRPSGSAGRRARSEGASARGGYGAPRCQSGP